MEHRTTVVELVIEPTDLYGIIQNWALESKFTLYEKNRSRTVYAKSMRGAKAWLSIENDEKDAKLEAWLSSESVGPEFSGNLWVGWKIALPQGFAIGTPAAYRKQVQKLLSLLSNRSTNMVRFEAGKQANPLQPTLNKSTMTKGLAVFGVISFIFGIVTLLSAVSLILQGSFLSLANTMLTDAASDMILGALSFASSKALSKGKALGIWLYGSGILVDTIYNITMGHTPNYFVIGFGLLLIWRMIELKSEWNLT